jgi:Ca2+-binding RTX toxin-like protein
MEFQMTTHTLHSDKTTQWKITGQSDTWIVAADGKLTVKGMPAIVIDYGADDNRINIDGRILNLGHNAAGITVLGDDNTINIGAKGRIDAYDGFFGDGTNTTINNKGEIRGVDCGMFMQHTAHVYNSGIITGNQAIVLQTSDVSGIPHIAKAQGGNGVAFDNVVLNRDGGLIMGAETGVYFGAAGSHKIVNDGTISGYDVAIMEAAGTLNLINNGDIEGAVDCSDGNDRIDNRKGFISSDVYGGKGDDLYIVSGKLTINEKAGEGWDTVKSTVSYTLNDNVDYLTLLGKANLTGHGNDINNTVVGNSGNNTLYGEAGFDKLDGGKGNDILTGGLGSDVYIFNKGSGMDTVTDFDNANDTISLRHLDGMSQFSDLSGHISQHGNDVWLSFADGDRLILKDTPIGDMDTADFLFG